MPVICRWAAGMIVRFALTSTWRVFLTHFRRNDAMSIRGVRDVRLPAAGEEGMLPGRVRRVYLARKEGVNRVNEVSRRVTNGMSQGGLPGRPRKAEMYLAWRAAQGIKRDD
jgi:hypothetical protein